MFLYKLLKLFDLIMRGFSLFSMFSSSEMAEEEKEVWIRSRHWISQVSL